MLEAIIPGSRASLVFDVIVISMPLVLIAIAFSLYKVRVYRDYDFHKKMQLTISIVLLLVIVWFEVNVRVYGWTDRAHPSPYYDSILFPFLYIHTAIATSAAVLWTTQVWLALRQFGKDYAISAKNRKSHISRGRLTIGFMLMTTITGWTFYWMAFIAA